MKHTLDIGSVEPAFADRKILQGVYIRVETGAVTGLLGSNGSGKSCLMNILFGMLHPAFKSLRFDGVWADRFGADEVRCLPQHGFVPDNLRMDRVLRDYGLDAADFFGWFPDLDKLRGSRFGTLSGGERRVVEFYAILCPPCRFVLLDEPFSQVMPLHIDTFCKLLEREKRNKGILLTDHRYRQVRAVSDSLCPMSGGTTRPVRRAEELVRWGYVNRTD